MLGFFPCFLFFCIKFCIRNNAVTRTIKHFLCITIFFRFAIPFSWTCDHVTGAVSFDLKFKKRSNLWSERERLGILKKSSKNDQYRGDALKCWTQTMINLR